MKLFFSIDGTAFMSESDMKRHNEEIKQKIEYYSYVLEHGIYTLEELQAIYDDYESHREAWQKAETTQFLHFLAGQYALKTIIKSNKEESKNAL